MSAATAADAFQVLDTDAVSPDLRRLHELVVHATGRIEIVGEQGSSVLLSKTELDSLERALAVLSATDEFRELCDAVAHMAHEVVST